MNIRFVDYARIPKKELEEWVNVVLCHKFGVDTIRAPTWPENPCHTSYCNHEECRFMPRDDVTDTSSIHSDDSTLPVTQPKLERQDNTLVMSPEHDICMSYIASKFGVEPYNSLGLIIEGYSPYESRNQSEYDHAISQIVGFIVKDKMENDFVEHVTDKPSDPQPTASDMEHKKEEEKRLALGSISPNVINIPQSPVIVPVPLVPLDGPPSPHTKAAILRRRTVVGRKPPINVPVSTVPRLNNISNGRSIYPSRII